MESITKEEMSFLLKIQKQNEVVYSLYTRLADLELFESKEEFIRTYCMLKQATNEFSKLINKIDFLNPKYRLYYDFLLGTISNYQVDPIETTFYDREVPIEQEKLSLILNRECLNAHFGSRQRNLIQEQIMDNYTYYIEDLINKSFDTKQKKRLILQKYDIAYLELNSNSEYEPFKSNKALELNLTSLAKALKIEKEKVRNYFYQTKNKQIDNQISKILSTSDRMIESPRLYAETQLRIAYLKSLLLGEDEFIFYYYVEKIKRKIEIASRKEIKPDNYVNTISSSLLETALTELHKDRKQLIIK